MGHWYNFEGKACHFQPNGRDTTLREARKQNLLPSVTTILGLLDKPALTRWRDWQITKAAWVIAFLGETFAEHTVGEIERFHKKVMAEAFQDSTAAKDRGTEIHNCLEQIVKGGGEEFPEDIFEISYAAWEIVTDYCETSDFTAEQIVVGDGYAGMVDLHNDEFCIDYKTKDIKETDTPKKLAYPEMAQQLSAYEMALWHGNKPLTHRGRRCVNVFIDRQIPGKVLIHEWTPEEISVAWYQFDLLVSLWQSLKKYIPEDV